MIGISNVKEKIYDQSVSKGEDLKNIKSETENQLNSKSQPEAHNRAPLLTERPTQLYVI